MKNFSGTQYVDIDEWGSGVKVRCLNHAFSKIEDLVPKSQHRSFIFILKKPQEIKTGYRDELKLQLAV
jgi:hypothetical protein